MQCEEGYGVDKHGKCSKFGSTGYPIAWKFSHTNIERDRFKVKFYNVTSDFMEDINKLPKANITDLNLGEGDLENKEHFKLDYIDFVSKKEWILNCKFKVGLGIRNLSLSMKNESVPVHRELM